MQTLKRNISGTAAYMVGVNEKNLMYNFEDEPDFFKKINSIKEARIIRILCQIRTAIFRHFSEINQQIYFEMKNLDRIDYFNSDDIKWLETNGIKIIRANTQLNTYIIEINRLINNNIDKCSKLIPDFVNWSYIKNLFVIPNSTSGREQTALNAIHDERKKFNANLNYYPFQNYFRWPYPYDAGYFFSTDRKFLTLIYKINKDEFHDSASVMDASDETKGSIYEYLDNSERTVIVVDCENSDPYKLTGVLQNLSEENLKKVQKIILYDDKNTTTAWQLLSRFTNIEVEHIEVDRISEHKSLVDMRLAMGVAKEFYSNRIDSFILCSSDSDFWALINSLNDADFLVMIEYSKAGTAIKEALEEKNIYYCYMDDFCRANSHAMKDTALLMFLKNKINIFNQTGNFGGLDIDDLMNDMYYSCRIEANEQERKRFYEKYLKTMRLVIKDNKFRIELNA